MLVLDASAFIEEYEPEGDTATIPRVRDELDDASGFRFDAMEGSGMLIHIPDEQTIETVRSAARTTGDETVLSETDTRLLGAALELEGTVVTDDYAIQNVAGTLEIEVEVIAQDGITEQREWLFQCQGCGREFEAEKPRCPICGTELERKNPSN